MTPWRVSKRLSAVLRPPFTYRLADGVIASHASSPDSPRWFERQPPSHGEPGAQDKTGLSTGGQLGRHRVAHDPTGVAPANGHEDDACAGRYRFRQP